MNRDKLSFVALRLLRSEEGTGYLELALTLPIFALVAFASLEAAGSIGALQLATSLSREIALAGYRECAVDTAPISAGPATPSDCLQEVLTRINAQYASTPFVGPSSISISIYTPPAGAGATFTSGILLGSGAIGPSTTSKFAPANFTTTEPLGESLAMLGRLVVAEVTMPTNVAGSNLSFLSYLQHTTVYASSII